MMRALVSALAIAASASVQAGQVKSVRYVSFRFGSAFFHAAVADPEVGPVSPAVLFAPRLVSVKSLLAEDVPAAALTGTFFGFENQVPVADVVVDGDPVAEGNRGSVLAVDWFGKVSIFHPKFKQELDWFPYRYVLRGAVRLIENKKVVPNPKAQRFRDSNIWGRAARTGVGLTKAGKIVLLCSKSSITLSTLGKAMRTLGVVDAVSLDGGGSTMMFYRGSYVVPPGRSLNTLFVLYERDPLDHAFHRHLDRIADNQDKGIIDSLKKAIPARGGTH